MGARFRLRASFDGSHFSADASVVIHAMKRYGLIVADNGSDWYFQGTVDPRWTNGFVDQLKQIPILPADSRLEQDATYIDLADPDHKEFKATSGMAAGPDSLLVPKTEVDYQLWNRLRGVTDPARTGAVQGT